MPTPTIKAGALAVSLAAVADPARNGEQEFQACFVSESRSLEIF
jgi:hypothetical protein